MAMAEARLASADQRSLSRRRSSGVMSWPASRRRSACSRACLGRRPPAAPRTSAIASSPSALLSQGVSQPDAVEVHEPCARGDHDDQPGGGQQDAGACRPQDRGDLGRAGRPAGEGVGDGRDGDARDERQDAEEVQEQGDVVAAHRAAKECQTSPISAP